MRRLTKPIYRWGGIALTVVAAIYFFYFAAENWSRLPSISLDGRSVTALAIALALYVVTLFSSAIAWRFLLRAVGETPPVRHIIVISLLSQFAKYFPGNVAHHIARVALARAYGLNAPRVILTIAVETGWVIFTAATISVIAFLAGAPAVFENAPQFTGVWQFVFAGGAAALAPLAGAQVLKRWCPVSLRRLLASETIHMPSLPVLLRCFAIYVFNYVLMGAILYLLAARIFGQTNIDFLLLTGIFAVAWVAGFLMPGAPGGLGIREAILVTVLGPLYGEGIAVAITVVLRAITVVGDGLGFLAGLVARRTFLKGEHEGERPP